MNSPDDDEENLILQKCSEYKCGIYQKGKYADQEDLTYAFLEEKTFFFDTSKYHEKQFNRRMIPIFCNSVIFLISLVFGNFYVAALLGVILVVMLVYALVARVGTSRAFVMIGTTGVLVRERGVSYIPWREVARMLVETRRYQKTGVVFHFLVLYNVHGSKIMIPVEGSDTSELVFGDPVIGLATLVQTYFGLARERRLRPDLGKNLFDF